MSIETIDRVRITTLGTETWKEFLSSSEFTQVLSTYGIHRKIPREARAKFIDTLINTIKTLGKLKDVIIIWDLLRRTVSKTILDRLYEKSFDSVYEDKILNLTNTIDHHFISTYMKDLLYPILDPELNSDLFIIMKVPISHKQYVDLRFETVYHNDEDIDRDAKMFRLGETYNKLAKIHQYRNSAILEQIIRMVNLDEERVNECVELTPMLFQGLIPLVNRTNKPLQFEGKPIHLRVGHYFYKVEPEASDSAYLKEVAKCSQSHR